MTIIGVITLIFIGIVFGVGCVNAIRVMSNPLEMHLRGLDENSAYIIFLLFLLISISSFVGAYYLS